MAWSWRLSEAICQSQKFNGLRVGSVCQASKQHPTRWATYALRSTSGKPIVAQEPSTAALASPSGHNAVDDADANNQAGDEPVLRGTRAQDYDVWRDPTTLKVLATGVIPHDLSQDAKKRARHHQQSYRSVSYTHLTLPTICSV